MNGRVAQLNRVADYGSAGYRFESCRGHCSFIYFGRVAQLNRVADYGSAGCRFESCRDHKILCNFIVEDFFCPFHRIYSEVWIIYKEAISMLIIHTLSEF